MRLSRQDWHFDVRFLSNRPARISIVTNGLPLSVHCIFFPFRALGDHSYKNVSNLSDREQMISALPDIKSMVLEPQDEFMVIACDGIWSVINSDTQLRKNMV